MNIVVKGFILFLVSFQCAISAKEPPKWSELYSVSGTLYLPYAEIAEPFDVWYDYANGHSRIDYYGGMVKTYQLPNAFRFGTGLKVAPVTTESETNVQTCLQVNGSAGSTIVTQSVIPDLDGYQYLGEEIVNGVKSEKWEIVSTVNTKVNRYTMWLTYSADVNGDKIAVPVRYEMKGYEALLGSHYDHYRLDYESFNTEQIDPNVFILQSNMSCGPFPGPGDTHIYSSNPMAEFVHPVRNSHVDFEFDKFKTKHNKDYESIIEHERRKGIFTQNLRFIHSMNRKQNSFSLGVNHLADRTDAERSILRGRRYSGVYNGGSPFPYKKQRYSKAHVPEQYDWRLYGAVTPVKDQAVCGSCWSFGTVGTIEGAYFLKSGGDLKIFSPQALVDCSWGYGNNGCDGGEDFRSYQWMMKHGGLPTEDDYGPYLGQDGYCHATSVPLTAKITGYVNVTANDENALKFAIFKHGPISVAIDAGHRSFSFYSHGVYYEPNCGNRDDQLDHAVLAVGYGKMNGQFYWLIKNSWSTYWGDDGYVLISENDNNCGVMTSPTYVTM